MKIPVFNIKPHSVESFLSSTELFRYCSSVNGVAMRAIMFQVSKLRF